MKHVNFHDLRHSCATILLQSGADRPTFSKILGHASVRTTARCSHVETDARKAAVEKALG